MYLPCVSTDPRLVLGYHKDGHPAGPPPHGGTMTRNELIQILSDSGEDPTCYDIDAILTALAAVEQAGEVDSDTFWLTVATFARPDDDPADQFAGELAEAIRTAPVGTPATWQGEDVTVSVIGASRVRLDWPQPVAKVAITTPDGAATTLDGGDIGSWGELWQHVQAAAATWQGDVDLVVDAAARLNRQLEQLERQAMQVRARRNKLLQTAHRRGVTAYRMSKRTGLSESFIGRIVS